MKLAVEVDFVVIGAGLVGSAIARSLEKVGCTVATLDSSEPMAASKCSLGVWKDGWLGSIKQKATQGLEFLDSHLGIKAEERDFYNVDNNKNEPFLYIHRDSILLAEEDILRLRVIGRNKFGHILAKSEDGVFEFQPTKGVIVATGAFTPLVLAQMGIVNNVYIDSYWGADFHYKGRVEDSVVTWAPYKQVVVFQDSKDTFQFSDGTTVKNPKTNDPRVAKASDRLIQHFNVYMGTSFDESNCYGIMEGLRPYLQNKNQDYVQEVAPNVLVATGGAKSTTVLCGYMAKKTLEHFGLLR